MHARRYFIAGNWKMNTDRESGARLAKGLVDRVGMVDAVDIAVCPPFVYLALIHEVVASSKIAVGAQNVYFEKSGAFTGEIAPTMLGNCGCKYVIVGHSERRHVLGETDEAINRKLKAAFEANLQPILCVGETLAEREINKTKDVVLSQLRGGLIGVPFENLRRVTIAYEPVWAIGTGKVATPEQAEDVHAFIRETIVRMYGADLGHSIRIQYGGSVKGDNAEGLLRQPNIDGALVGGASLQVEDFANIVRAAVKLAGN